MHCQMHGDVVNQRGAGRSNITFRTCIMQRWDGMGTRSVRCMGIVVNHRGASVRYHFQDLYSVEAGWRVRAVSEAWGWW